uniref:Uncharacterized protein n=1 Tax=Euplotes harpa TaxID=151035 RepID=A0A7S3J3E8_9SPIT
MLSEFIFQNISSAFSSWNSSSSQTAASVSGQPSSSLLVRAAALVCKQVFILFSFPFMRSIHRRDVFVVWMFFTSCDEKNVSKWIFSHHANLSQKSFISLNV